MESNPALARNNTPIRSRESTNSASGAVIMDRAGRVYIIAWSRRAVIANVRAWYAHIARRAQHWWRGQDA